VKSKDIANKLFSMAGIEIGGNDPWHISVHNDDFYDRVMTWGSLGLGESYMDGWWDCTQLDEFFYRVLRTDIESQVKQNWFLLANVLCARLFNMQSKKRAFQIGERHYDIGNDLFMKMLWEGYSEFSISNRKVQAVNWHYNSTS